MITFPNRAWETTSTAGAGTAFTLAGVADPAYRTFAQECVDEASVYYGRWDSAGNYEAVIGTYDSGLNKITPVTGIWSSAMAPGAVTFIPINWTGTQNVIGAAAGKSFVMADNDLEEVGATAVGLALLRAATALAQRVALGIDISSLTGGTAGKVVRGTTTANTVTDASQADTIEQLASLLFMAPDGAYIPPGGKVSGLSGLTAGTVYYLSTAGALTSTAPTPSAILRRVLIGTAISTTVLNFTPGTPIGG